MTNNAIRAAALIVALATAACGSEIWGPQAEFDKALSTLGDHTNRRSQVLHSNGARAWLLTIADLPIGRTTRLQAGFAVALYGRQGAGGWEARSQPRFFPFGTNPMPSAFVDDALVLTDPTAAAEACPSSSRVGMVTEKAPFALCIHASSGRATTEYDYTFFVVEIASGGWWHQWQGAMLEENKIGWTRLNFEGLKAGSYTASVYVPNRAWGDAEQRLEFSVVGQGS
jgi:hypothetical protein